MSRNRTTGRTLAVPVPSGDAVQDLAGANKIRITRNAGHPWDGRAGFDVMEVEVDSDFAMDRVVAIASKKFWSPWLVGRCESGLPGGFFYKPCDVQSTWTDDPSDRHPGCVRLLQT